VKSSTKKPKRKPPVWRSVTAANAPDPRVNVNSKEYGKRTVLTVFAIDSLGRLCRVPAEADGGEAVILSTPPGANEEGG